MTEYRKHDQQASTAEFRNQIFREFDLEGKKVLNVGCGNDYVEGWVNLDGDVRAQADMYVDLEDETELRLKLNKDEYDFIYCSHILEHIHNLVRLKSALTRALAPGGLMVVVVPYYMSMDAWGDDTHCRAFSEESFLPSFWPGMDDIRINLIDLQKQLGKVRWIVAYLTKGGKDG
jgi:predicted SAM-dependent methyltransferase